MTPERLRWCLDRLGWSQRQLALELACDPRLVRRWAAGAPGYTVPDLVARWLEALTEAHAGVPVPTAWRRNSGYRPAAE